MEVTTLKCENAVMRLYGAKLPDPEPAPDVEQPAIPAPPALPGPPMNTADAIRQVLNGHPMDNTEIFAEIRKRFPDCQTTYETCRNSLSFLSKRKEVVSRSRGFGARLTYTKAVVDPKRC